MGYEGRGLKKYEEYLRRIGYYARAVKLKIKYDHVDCLGEYIPSRRTIKIDPELTNSEEIAVMLHELGHALDDKMIDTKKDEKIRDKAYGAVYDETATKEQMGIVMGCEIRAWKYGKVIARILGIPLGTWYTRTAKTSLQGYKRGQVNG